VVFDSIGWAEILVLVIASLFIFGPDRLPAAAAWLGRTVRQVREYATGARDQLKAEMGPDFEEFRKPLEELRGLRDFDPRRRLTSAFLDDSPNGNGTDWLRDAGNGSGLAKKLPDVSGRRPLDPGERPPMDPDAT
jgi:sec-independent protein translocase protein TatB